LVNKYYNTVSPTTKKQLLTDPAMSAAVGKVKAYSANIASARRVPTATQLPNAPKAAKTASTASTRRTGVGSRGGKGRTTTGRARNYYGTSSRKTAFNAPPTFKLPSMKTKMASSGKVKLTTYRTPKLVAIKKPKLLRRGVA